MPEKSRERRIQIAKRQGKSTAIKSSDVGLAKGLSTHAAKKSRHVEGMRTVEDRNVDRKMPPGRGKKTGATARPSAERVISKRTPSSLAAKTARQRNG